METGYKTKISIMKVKLPFILCVSTEIREDSPLALLEMSFLSFKGKFEISFFLTQCYSPSLSKLFKQKKKRQKMGNIINGMLSF